MMEQNIIIFLLGFKISPPFIAQDYIRRTWEGTWNQVKKLNY
jgi:hypothetical protein